jgi:hypothetical protein
MMPELRKFHVKLGEATQVKSGFLLIGPRTEVIYTGMVSKEIFSLAIGTSIMYNSMAYNVFLPMGHREVHAAGGRLEILEINPDYILFNYIG